MNDLIAWLPGWQAAYLNALRDGDMHLAETLHLDAAGRFQSLRTGIADPLKAAGAWTTRAIDALERDIGTTLILAG